MRRLLPPISRPNSDVCANAGTVERSRNASLNPDFLMRVTIRIESLLAKYNVRRARGALHLGTRDGANRSARLVRRVRSRAAMARSQGVVLRGVLVRAPENHRREMRFVRTAVERGRRGIPLHRVPRRSAAGRLDGSVGALPRIA